MHSKSLRSIWGATANACASHASTCYSRPLPILPVHPQPRRFSVLRSPTSIDATIATSADSESKRGDCHHESGIAMVVAALRLTDAGSSVQQRNCAAILSLVSGSSESRQVIAATGGIEALLAVVQTYVVCDEVVEPACHALLHLAACAPANMARLVAAGGQRILHAVVRRYSHLNTNHTYIRSNAMLAMILEGGAISINFSQCCAWLCSFDLISFHRCG